MKRRAFSGSHVGSQLFGAGKPKSRGHLEHPDYPGSNEMICRGCLNKSVRHTTRKGDALEFLDTSAS